jgi:hypothetical protein
MIEFKSRLGFDVLFVLWTKFEVNSPIFIGVFAPAHRGLRDLTNLSLSHLQITMDKEDLSWGQTQFQPKPLTGMNLGCGLGYPPIGSDSALSGQIPFATWVHAR